MRGYGGICQYKQPCYTPQKYRHFKLRPPIDLPINPVYSLKFSKVNSDNGLRRDFQLPESIQGAAIDPLES
jgi:hypothetical protein